MTEVLFPRSHEKWTPYEEQKLSQLFDEAEAHPERKYWWCGKWRANPVFHVAKILGRTPCAVAGRRQALLQCKRRPSSDAGRRIELSGGPR